MPALRWVASRRQEARRWNCLDCGRGFSDVRGIPDLRVRDDPYLANEDDWRIARQLDAAFDRCDFRQLLGVYYDLAGDTTPAHASSDRSSTS